ncbi:MAG: SDR family NAD(P)-dependent oxidoreductase [Prevotella sp.]|nr:SDR family NAD(P)-dependent oxidoreductase [Prevotella sp.]
MESRRAIIMGASSGMGYRIAEIFLEKGWQLGVAARREELLLSLKENHPDKVVTASIDVNDAKAGELLLQMTERMGGIDLYFHVSGIGKQNMELQQDVELSTVETNGTGFTRCITTMFNYMADHGGGQIAAISSIAGTKGLGAAPSYSATKAFQNIYLEALEQQASMRYLNIRITDIRPGFVATPLLGDDPHYPMLMDTERTAQEIVRAVLRQKHVRVLDWRYRILTPLWRLIPRWLWRRLNIR